MSEAFALHPKCLLTELEDGSGVVLNLDTKFYFTLNETAVALWKALQLAPQTATELSQRLVEEFEVTAEEARADVALLIGELLSQGLLQPARA